MDILAGLNDAQKRAVLTTSGPLLILAGAGSGKTKTLTHRIAHLLTKEDIKPEQILAVTFTNKAAKEMRERLAQILNIKQAGREFMPWMGTFHGICVRLLRLDGHLIGISRNFVIYDQDDRESMVKSVIKELGFDPKIIKPSMVADIISKSKNDMRSSADYEASASYPNQKQIARVYTEYERQRKKSSALDFDDLLIEVVRLFSEIPEARKKWSSFFKHILIDEYQDTNAAQYAIVKALVGKDKNICVVGDDWQSIYSWRGADYKNILNFERDFPGAVVIKLEENYRSTGNILAAAQNVITKNQHRSNKSIWTAAGDGLPVNLQIVRDEAEEAYVIASSIQTQVSGGKYGYGDFTILYRTNSLSAGLEKAFINFRIPYKIIGGIRFFDRKEIKDIMAYLKLIYQPSDVVSFNRIANVPTRGLGQTSLQHFISWWQDSGLDIIESLKLADKINGLQPRAKSALVGFGNILSKLKSQIESLPPAEIIDSLIKITAFRDYLDDASDKAVERLENVDALLVEAQNYSNLADFLEEVSLMSSADQVSDEQAVSLMTLHAAKGLEFPVVYIVGLEENILPHARVYSSERPDDLEEERRLMYVGMTRAREELYLTAAESRLQFGGRTYNPLSRFIADAEISIEIPNFLQKTINDNDYDDFDQSLPFDIGDRVRSAYYGKGEIIDIDGAAVSVRFDNGVTKKLNSQFANLEKL